MSKTICLISANDLIYNPRLLKLGDSLSERGFSVSAVEINYGMGEGSQHNNFFEKRHWAVNTVDLSKQTAFSYRIWLVSSFYQKINSLALGVLPNCSFFQESAVIKGFEYLLAATKVVKADWYICNQPSLLPIACKAAEKNSGRVWYDSQEYFRGMTDCRDNRDILVQIENAYIHEASLITASSKQVATAINNDHNLSVFPLRNAPTLKKRSQMSLGKSASLANSPLGIVWHGFNVNLQGRGVSEIISALGKMKEKAVLTLQGFISETSKAEILQKAEECGVSARIIFRKAASPDNIVESLLHHDVGIAAEPGIDENQRLTSSNKVFEYLMAGLAIVVSDMPGLLEVLQESGAGLVYSAGKSQELAQQLDKFSRNRVLLNKCKERANVAATSRLNWAEEFSSVMEASGFS